MNNSASTNEVALNAQLAEVLRGKHPLWRNELRVEQTGVFSENLKLQPDILIVPSNAQPIVIETEFQPASTVEDDACARLGLIPTTSELAIEQAIAIRLPDSLRSNQSDLPAQIGEAEFEYCVFSGDRDHPLRWPTSGWLSGSIDDIVRCLEHAMISQRLVSQSIEILERGVRVATQTVANTVTQGFVDIERDFGRMLNQTPGEQTNRMAMTIVANALTFHSTISGIHDIPATSSLKSDMDGTMARKVLDCWERILSEINYWPIFRIATDLMDRVRAATAHSIMRTLIPVSERLAQLGVTTRHDLAGRMFQKLISDRKFLATFYTLPTSASLLAELSVARMNVDWRDLRMYTDLRIADFSCGTGTLLSTAYQAVLARYRHARGDDREIHAQMIERAIVAADIMPAAAHLCASQLSSVHPTIGFDNTCVYTMPYGLGEGEEVHGGPFIGSLDLIAENQVASLFPTGQRQVRGTQRDEALKDAEIEAESIDLVIMNPPFTSPTNHKMTEVPVPSFAGFQTNEDEQRAMSARLKRIRQSLDQPAGHGNAGLASNFIDLAHAKLKPGGVIAFVLPIAFIRGAAWQSARNLLLNHYEQITLITVASTGARNRAFSADTSMAETLLIANKKTKPTKDESETLFVNLHSRPSTIAEAAEVAKLVRSLSKSQRTGKINAGDQELGSYIFAPLTQGGCAALRTSSLADTMIDFFEGRLRLPRFGDTLKIPMVSLGELGQRGLLHRDIGDRNDAGTPPYRGPFTVRPKSGVSSYPMIWNHDAERERCLLVQPDSAGEVRPNCEQRAVEAWTTASRLHFNLDFGISGQSTAACLTSEMSLGGRAWPNFRTTEDRWQELLVLWSNCTLGLMSFWWMGSRQHDGRSILTITSLPKLPVIDARKISPSKLGRAVEVFEDFKDAPLLPANEAYHDDVRDALDRTVLIDLLDLPSEILEPIAHLRLLWCAEPTVHGGKKTGSQIELQDAV